MKLDVLKVPNYEEIQIGDKASFTKKLFPNRTSINLQELQVTLIQSISTLNMPVKRFLKNDWYTACLQRDSYQQY